MQEMSLAEFAWLLTLLDAASGGARQQTSNLCKLSVRRDKTLFGNQVLMLASVGYRKRKGSYQLTRNYSRKNNLKSRQSIS